MPEMAEFSAMTPILIGSAATAAVLTARQAHEANRNDFIGTAPQATGRFSRFADA